MIRTDLQAGELPTAPTWNPPSACHSLGNRDVHIWRLALDRVSDTIANPSSFLNLHEQDRAQRLVFEKDRKHFIAARSILRLLLANYLSCSPREVVIVSAPGGKPYLGSGSNLRFNLSHSAGLAVYAFARERELGVDIERLRTDVACHEIVHTHFSVKERQEFSAIPPADSTAAFYSGWSRKEAYLKARGDGLQLPLQGFSVSLQPGVSFQLVSEDADRWGTYSFSPAEHFVGALVVEGKNFNPVFFEWLDQAAAQSFREIP